jgi:hypothetical protein
MAIDESGEWWIGSDAADIKEYLDALTTFGSGYRVTAFWSVICPCGSDRFCLVKSRATTQRTCAKCEQVRYIVRFGNELGWKEDEADLYTCVGCRGRVVNVCLGFADYAGHPGYKDRPGHPLPDAVLWFFVGVRCVTCGILACFNDGKVGRGPMAKSTFREIAGELPDEKEV